MIHEIKGNIWDTSCDIITIPTNTVGVMGAGLAKQLKERDYSVYEVYKHHHNTKNLSVYRPELIRGNTGWFLLFHTKQHFRDPSQLRWVDNNLQWIRKNYEKGRVGDLLGLQSIALPAVGCGLGGLDFTVVRELIYEYLGDLDLKVELYLPDIV